MIAENEGKEAHSLILRLFERYIFPDYTEEGRHLVREYVNLERLLKSDLENFTLIAEADSKIVGVLKVKRSNHLSLLFVDELSQRKGIGRALLLSAIKECCSRLPNLETITVNSSRYALIFYKKIGFMEISKEKCVHGVVFIPMELNLSGTNLIREMPSLSGSKYLEL